MPYNNKYVYFKTETPAELASLIAQEIAKISGFTLSDDGVIWLNDKHTLGIVVKMDGSYFRVCVRLYGNDTNLNSSITNPTSNYLIYNYSQKRNVFAFNTSTNQNVQLRWAIVKDEDGVARVMFADTASSIKLFAPENQSIIVLNCGYPAINLNFFGVTLVKMPTLFTKKTYPEMYYIFGTRETSWGSDGIIVADGNYYKLIPPSTNSYGALVFPVGDS